MLVSHWSDRLGDWNPQLLRELKSRFRPRNLLLVVGGSLLAQTVLMLWCYGQLIHLQKGIHSKDFTSPYCTKALEYVSDRLLCVVDPVAGVLVDWQAWWADLFIHLTIIGGFILVVAGMYLLVQDLQREDQRDTLNFIRLTPRTTTNIMVGKLLGVPSLLYVFGLLAVPLHLVAAFGSGIPFPSLVLFYVVEIASFTFFYSAAILFSLTTSWMGGLRAWFIAGLVGLFLLFVFYFGSVDVGWAVFDAGGTFLYSIQLFNPVVVLPYLIQDATMLKFLPGAIGYLGSFPDIYLYSLPVGISVGSTAALALANYGIWIYWIWQGIERCFRKPHASILSKRHSYLVIAYFEVLGVGFFNTDDGLNFEELASLLVSNVYLFLILIAALSPHRQTLQDWARYHHLKKAQRQAVKSRLNRLIIHPATVMDLICGENSPALLAIALNVGIMVILLSPWVLVWPPNYYLPITGLMLILLTANMILIYAGIVQLLLYMRTAKRVLWAVGTIGSVTILFPMAFRILPDISYYSMLSWLFSPAPWVSIDSFTTQTLSISYLTQLGLIGLLSLRLAHQLNQAGKSASKGLLSQAQTPLPEGVTEK